VLFAVKSVFLVWMLLNYTDGAVVDFMGLDVDKAHELMVERLNKILVFSGGQLELKVELTYSLLSLMAGFISFTMIKVYVNFAYYFFVMHRTASKKTAAGFMDTQSAGKRFTFRTLIRLLYANFLAPILISFLFVHELTGSIVE